MKRLISYSYSFTYFKCLFVLVKTYFNINRLRKHVQITMNTSLASSTALAFKQVDIVIFLKTLFLLEYQSCLWLWHSDERKKSLSRKLNDESIEHRQESHQPWGAQKSLHQSLSQSGLYKATGIHYWWTDSNVANGSFV